VNGTKVAQFETIGKLDTPLLRAAPMLIGRAGLCRCRSPKEPRWAMPVEPRALTRWSS